MSSHELVHLRLLNLIQFAIVIGVEPGPERRTLLHVRRDLAPPGFKFLARRAHFVAVKPAVVVVIKATNDFRRRRLLRLAATRLARLTIAATRLRTFRTGWWRSRADAATEPLTLIGRQHRHELAVELGFRLPPLSDQVCFLINQRAHAFKIGLLLAKFLLQVLAYDQNAVAEDRRLLHLPPTQALERAGLRFIKSQFPGEARDQRLLLGRGGRHGSRIRRRNSAGRARTNETDQNGRIEHQRNHQQND